MNIFSKIGFLLKMKRQQKVFPFYGRKIKYLFEPNDSPILIVVFSSFPGKWRKARYNYVSTLSKTPANKLFILDNFGYRKKGSYYLGKTGISLLKGLSAA